MKWAVKVGAVEAPDAAPKCESAASMVGWLKRLCLGEAVELRALKVTRRGTDARHSERATYPTTPEGLARMARDARELSPRAEGVYFTLNPVRPDLADYAAAEDVLRRDWLLVDVDPVRPSDVSASDVEKQSAWMVAAAIREDLERGYVIRPTVVADSGNGYHLLYRIQLPADDGGIVARVLKALAAKYDGPDAKVDVKVGNAARICKLYGTIARKGRHAPDRPHRRSVVLEMFPDEVVSRESLEALAGEAPAASPAPPKPRHVDGWGWVKTVAAPEADPLEAHAAEALRRETAAVASTGPGNRNNQLIASACALFELANAGTLDRPLAESSLRDAARAAGLDEQEIDQTLASARRRTEGKARDVSHVGKEKGKPGRPSKKVVVDKLTGLKEPVDDERRLARLYLRERCKHPDGVTLRFWNGNWNQWAGGAYRIVDDKEVKAGVTAVAKAEFERHARAVDADILPFGTRAAGNVLASLQSIVFTSTRDVPGQPHWFDEEGWPPKECLNFRNGVLHLPTLVAEGPGKALRAPTPRYFTSNVLDYDFDPSPPEPKAWFAFLDSIWGDDPESIQALQQWFGYLLTPDTSLQKILMIVGPPRAGKGTIMRLLCRLLGGDQNAVGTTLTEIGTHFGTQDLIGKSLAYFGETRLTGRGDSQAIVERLLSISGEDLQSIPQKNTTSWKGRLPTRFVMLANETPRLGDVSNALMSRMIILALTRKFEGKEDDSLDAKLAAEIPGILFWAIEGWRALRETRRFIQPASAETAREEMREAGNPVGLFVEECVEIGTDFQVPRGHLFDAWVRWCKANGRDRPGTAQAFFQMLRTHLRNQGVEVGDAMKRQDGKPTRFLVGVRVVGEYAPPPDDRSGSF